MATLWQGIGCYKVSVGDDLTKFADLCAEKYVQQQTTGKKEAFITVTVRVVEARIGDC